MLSIVILQYNNPELTKQCVESLQRHCAVSHEIILVDNNSVNQDARKLGETLAGIRFVQNLANEGFGKGNNKGASIARGDILLFLNNDTIAEEDFCTPIYRIFEEDSQIGIVGPKVLNRDHSLQLSAGSLPSLVTELKDKVLYRSYEAGQTLALRYAQTKFSRTQRVEWVTGAALFVRRELFEKLNGFDEDFFMFFEDKDLCLRGRLLGAQVVYSVETSVIHLRGASINNTTERIYRESQLKYYRKHRGRLELMIVKNYLKYLRLDRD